MVEYFIGTNKRAHPRIIIPGLEVVKPGFLVIDIASVPEGVLPAEGVGQGAGAGEGIAPGVIGVFDHDLAGIVGDGDNVALGVVKIEVLGAVEANGHGLAVGIAADGHAVGTVEDVDKLANDIWIFDVNEESSCQDVGNKRKIRPRRGGKKNCSYFSLSGSGSTFSSPVKERMRMT